MLSGGVDSTYLLWHYKTKTDCDVHAHHVSYRTAKEPRWSYEDIAVTALEKHFDMEVQRSVVDYRSLVSTGWDSDTLYLVAAKASASMATQHAVLFGWNTDDMEKRVIQQREASGIYKRLWSTFRDAIHPGRRGFVPEAPRFPLLEMNKCKKDILEELPADVLRLCWSCRKPRAGYPCGGCEPCTEIRAAKDAQDAR
jgi:7-cyano-7-deazaguanine synthase in queuosine biosynthesis